MQAAGVPPGEGDPCLVFICRPAQQLPAARGQAACHGMAPAAQLVTMHIMLPFSPLQSLLCSQARRLEPSGRPLHRQNPPTRSSFVLSLRQRLDSQQQALLSGVPLRRHALPLPATVTAHLPRYRFILAVTHSIERTNKRTLFLPVVGFTKMNSLPQPAVPACASRLAAQPFQC